MNGYSEGAESTICGLWVLQEISTVHSELTRRHSSDGEVIEIFAQRGVLESSLKPSSVLAHVLAQE